MAMLASPKRKQKWSLNPRGKQWSEDPNKFGLKMLEKMGWSSGKGLGAKEQGITEHVRVKQKNDQVGIGYSKDRDDLWTEHQDDFNQFLQNLQKEQGMENAETDEKILSGKSLEERSKSSQKRVHYKKFTKGKDVNKYSSKDLANIFGKKNLEEKTNEENTSEPIQEVLDPIGTKDVTAGVLTVKGGNMSDYFKSQLNKVGYANNTQENLKKNSETLDIENKRKSKFYVNDSNEESESEINRYKGFGFTKFNNSNKSKSKKHNLNYVFDNPCLDLNILDNPPIKQETTVELDSNKVTPGKRKKKSSYEDDTLDDSNEQTPKKRKSSFIYENEGLDLNYIKKETTTDGYENPCLDLNYPDKHTPKRSREFQSESLSSVKNTSDQFQDKQMPKKKKKKHSFEALSSGIENLGLDIESPDKSARLSMEIDQIVANGIENPALDLNSSNEQTPEKINKNCCKKLSDVNALNSLSTLTPSKSKKRKSKSNSSCFENPALDIDFTKESVQPTLKKSTKESQFEISTGLINHGLDLESAIKKTPKKSKKCKNTEVLCNSDEVSIIYEENHFPSKFEVTRIVKGTTNDALDLSDEDLSIKRVTFNDQVESVANDIQSKRKKKKCKLDKYEVVTEKLKKKINLSDPKTFTNACFEGPFTNQEEVDNEANERKSNRHKRRKERRISSLETIEEVPDEEESSDDPMIVHEVLADNNCIQVSEENKVSEKKEKKKKTKSKISKTKIKSEENTDEQEINLASEIIEIEKIKKKKKKKSAEIMDVDNPEKENICKTSAEDKKIKVEIKVENNDNSEEEILSLEEFLDEKIEDSKPKIINDQIVVNSDTNLFQKRIITKKEIKSFFKKNPYLLFNGSNINDIKGYGSKMYNGYAQS